MKLTFIFVYLCFIVSARRHSDYYDESEEHVPLVDTVLDLRGTIRKYFAVEAAFLDHGRNMICSPLSVLMPLGKLILGAEKTSEDELLDALGLNSRKQVKNAFAQLITNMEYLPGVILDVASRIYVNTEHDIKKKFRKRTRLIFKSSIKKISADPSKTVRSINNWVAEMTRDKIQELLSPGDITEDTSLVLVNAVYFAGYWKDRFGEPFIDKFQSPSGMRQVPMMTRQGLYNYWQCDELNAQLIEIPYEGEQSAMIIVLPYSSKGLPVLLRALKLAPELLNQALEKMKTAHIILSMPKFKIETELDLVPLYRKVGLHTIFERKHSDLSGIIEDGNVYVTKAIHKAIIEVNEKGTEAAAATGVVVMEKSMPEDAETFDANRPFYFIIKAHKEQLFAGAYFGF